MITYDWQQRLKKDTLDFLEHKIPENDYDFEIIYNAYPERVNGEIPQPVITYVAKEMRKVIQNDPETYIDFLLFIQKNKGESGKKIFNYVMSKVTLKHPGDYDHIFKKAFVNTPDRSEIKKIFDNIILPLLKKYPEKYIDVIINTVRKEPQDDVIEFSFATLCKYMKVNKAHVKLISQKIDSFWNSDNKAIREGIVQVMKCLFKVDKRIYRDAYRAYKSTYNPNFIDILSDSICENTELIREIVERWEKSGNIRIKKAANNAEKTLKKIKRT
ncbi:MAG: hypothetical protein JW794_02680 [Candidatus Cloacimonetes bacterium]|nr:hypothetical protein [Candidatus Cloacimonadota bacterium]